MVRDLECWEQEYKDTHRNRWMIRGRTRRFPGQPRRRRTCHDHHSPPHRTRSGTGFFDGPLRKRPCPYPLTPSPRFLRLLVSSCEARTGLLSPKHAPRFRPALLALSAHGRDWVRPLADWAPPEGDARSQFASLIRHLVALYVVPSFLDDAWLMGLSPEGVTYQGWYKLIGQGRNIRTARDLPIRLTKRMAHAFVRAPDDLEIPAALRYAQVLGLGGDDRLARSLLGTRLARDFREDAFWATVIRWFIEHRSLDQVHHGPIVDFLHHQRFVPSVPNPSSRVRGEPRRSLLVPPQPNLCMKGRTPEALVRAVERWHRDLSSRVWLKPMEWTPSGITPLVHEAGTGEGRRVYETTELISTEELVEEGRAMRHCVAAYGMRCASGQSSIWSMTVEDHAGRVERLLTLEIQREDRRIIQVRGCANRRPTVDEIGILARWEDAGGPPLWRGLIDELPVELDEPPFALNRLGLGP